MTFRDAIAAQACLMTYAPAVSEWLAKAKELPSGPNGLGAVRRSYIRLARQAHRNATAARKFLEEQNG